MTTTAKKTIVPAMIGALLVTSMPAVEAEARGFSFGSVIVAASATAFLAGAGKRPYPEPYHAAPRQRSVPAAAEPPPSARHKPKPVKPEQVVRAAQKPAPVVRAKPKPEKPERTVVVTAARPAAKPAARDHARPAMPVPHVLAAAALMPVEPIVLPQVAQAGSVVAEAVVPEPEPSSPAVQAAVAAPVAEPQPPIPMLPAMPPASDLAFVAALTIEPVASPAPSEPAPETQAAPAAPATAVTPDEPAAPRVVADVAAPPAAASMTSAAHASLADMLTRLGAALEAMLPKRVEPVDAVAARRSEQALKQLLSAGGK